MRLTTSSCHRARGRPAPVPQLAFPILDAVERARLGLIAPLELRHTAAALWIDQGANPVTVQRRMGHKDVRTALQLYGHLFPEQNDRSPNPWKGSTTDLACSPPLDEHPRTAPPRVPRRRGRDTRLPPVGGQRRVLRNGIARLARLYFRISTGVPIGTRVRRRMSALYTRTQPCDTA